MERLAAFSEDRGRLPEDRILLGNKVQVVG